MNKRKIEAVIFDLGETLLIFGRLNRRALFNGALQRSYAYLKELSQPVGSYYVYRLFHTWGLRWHLLRSWMTGDDFDSLELLKSYGHKRKFSLSDAQWAELSWRWYLGLSETAHVEPGTAEALQQLHEMGLKVGLLSNTFVHGATLERHLENEGLLRWLPERFYSYDFDYRKPDTRIFTEVAAAMGVAAERTIYVGDRVDNDLEGSLAAGMLPVLKKAYTNEKVKIPANSACIETIPELPKWIQQNCQLPTPQEPTVIRETVCK